MDVLSDESGGEGDDGVGSPGYDGLGSPGYDGSGSPVYHPVLGSPGYDGSGSPVYHGPVLGSPGDNGVSGEERSYNSSEHINHDDSDEEEEEVRSHDDSEEEEEVRSRDDSDEEEEEVGSRNDSDHRRIHEFDVPRPYKRIRTSMNQTLKEDRLGLLPDSVLSHILSFLPTKDAVKTGVLSRRWLYLWTCVPNLTFSYQGGRYPQSKFDDFLNFIDRTLVFHSSGLKKFLLEFRYKDCLNSRVSAWLRFATRANVEELCLDLAGGRSGYPDDDTDDRYVLPQQLYTNSTIVKLSLALCDLMPSSVISWKALKSLSIKNTTLTEYIVGKILAGSPLLDFFELHDSCGCNCLDLRETNLKKLVLDTFGKVREGAGPELEIIAPKLRSLSILGWMQKGKLRLTNVQSVDECNLNFYQTSDKEYYEENYEARGRILIQVLQRLNHVNKLTLGPRCTEVLSTMAEKCAFLPTSRCKCLTLKTHLYRGDLPGVASLLRSSPFLQTLHIDMTSFDYGERQEYDSDENFFENYLTSGKEFALLSLKTVTIIGLVGGRQCRYEHVIPLAKFLLKIGKVLERMVISAQKVDGRRLQFRNHSRELLDVALKLLSCPRSSVQAVVELSE